MAKWIRARPYMTLVDIAARLRAQQESKQLQELQQQHGEQGLMLLAQALAVAAA